MTRPAPFPTPLPAAPAVEEHAGLARAMAGLEGLDGRPLSEHVEAFDRVHAALGDALARSDQA